MTPCRHRPRSHPFTLIEILVATFALSVLLAALVIPVRGGLREREEADRTAADQFRLRRAMDRVVNDFDGILCPGSTLTGDFVGTENETRNGRQDTLEFTTGVPGHQTPMSRNGGYVQVEYELVENDDGTGFDWVRTETINPLSDDEDENSVESTILRDVLTLEFSYYDGISWQDSWNTTADDEGLPEAIAVTFALAPEDEDDDPVPHRLLIPVLIESGENENSQSGEGGGQ